MSYLAKVKKFETTDSSVKSTPSRTLHHVSADLEGSKIQQLALMNLANAARVRLAEYRRAYGRQDEAAWLQHFDKARELCVETFPAGRRDRALRDYRKHYCEGAAAQLIAVHTIALELWTVHRQADTNVAFGSCLEAACEGIGLDIHKVESMFLGKV